MKWIRAAVFARKTVCGKEFWQWRADSSDISAA